jgi:hypothetical protein
MYGRLDPALARALAARRAPAPRSASNLVWLGDRSAEAPEFSDNQGRGVTPAQTLDRIAERGAVESRPVSGWMSRTSMTSSQPSRAQKAFDRGR